MKGLKLTRLFLIIVNEEQTQLTTFEIENALHEFSLSVFSLSKPESDLIDAYREINSAISEIELMVLKKKAKRLSFNSPTTSSTQERIGVDKTYHS